MSTPGGLHARTGSIKRTPSDLSRSLAEVNLPDPTAITDAGRRSMLNARTSEVNNELGELDLDEPEGEFWGLVCRLEGLV